MKITSVVTLVAALSGANAFSPASSNSRPSVLKAVDVSDGSELENMIGADVETGGRIYDPWGLNQWVPGEYARKAELANGRAAMLACVGWVWPAWFGTFAGPVTTTDPIDAVLQTSPEFWAQFIILCGVAENWKYNRELEGKSYTGDGEPAVDWTMYWGKMTDQGRDRMRMRELKNARLAMIGIASFAAAHFIPGSVPCLPPGF